MATNPHEFSPDEWDLLMRAPAEAVIAVVSAAPRERRTRFVVADAWLEAADGNAGARRLVPESALIDLLLNGPLHEPRCAMVARNDALAMCRAVRALLEHRVKPEELSAYGRFVMTIAARAARATREPVADERPDEREFLEELARALSEPAPAT
ncbi:MAG TPA: hypothetical protein VFD90_05715 [Gaiellales bacterium]|jgi:hypothetical protein|nr:hypothetical protein [Gaiellales bacterium]